MIGPVPWCLTCEHLHRPLQLGKMKCDAYPDGVPNEIVFGFDHRKPFKGDNGIRWKGYRGAKDKYRGKMKRYVERAKRKTKGAVK